MQARPAVLQINQVVLNQSEGMVYSSPFAPFVNAPERISIAILKVKCTPWQAKDTTTEFHPRAELGYLAVNPGTRTKLRSTGRNSNTEQAVCQS